MSDTYFCFSDECGDFLQTMSPKQLQTHPFYIRTTLIINANEWKKLNRDFKALKSEFGIPNSQELKWAYLWTIKYHQTKKKKIPSNNDAKFFEYYDYSYLIDFVRRSLALVNSLSEKKIIASYTKNIDRRGFTESQILCYHIQEHMQRIEMELNTGDSDNLGVLFIDPVSDEKNKLFRNIYSQLFEDGDFIKSYSHIKDSINIENSHQSVGIQVADYISGSFSAVLKANDKNKYEDGVKIFLIQFIQI